ncbi:sortase A, partial [Streptomyces sp. DfronAA-171]
MTALRPEHETGREPGAPLTDTPVMGTPVVPGSAQGQARAQAQGHEGSGAPGVPGPRDESTMALRLPAGLLDARGAVPARSPAAVPPSAPLPGEGRAARRRAAAKGGRGTGSPGSPRTG